MAHPTKSARFRHAPEAASVAGKATVNKVSAQK
jgi:hypothetical protein